MDPIYGIPPDLVRGPSADMLPMSANVNWGMEAMGVDRLRTHPARRIKIGIVDTGVDLSHPLLTNVVKAKDFTGSSSGAADRNGHGTHVTGTVGCTDPRIGVAAGWDLYHGKGLGDSGSGGSGLYRAIEWCLSEGCEVISNSWGGGTLDAATDRILRSYAEHSSRPWLFFAAGNSGPNTRQTDAPGVSQHVFNWAALNRDFSPATFTSAGDKIDSADAGVDILSTRTGGGFQTMSGTSMACPKGAGTMAYYRGALLEVGRPIPTVYELREFMASRSTDTHLPGDDRRTGPGWATPLLLALSLTPDPPPV